MNGFVKMLAVDFDDFNAEAAVKFNQLYANCESYTYSVPDDDYNYCWAKIDHDFVEQLNSWQQSYQILSLQDAINAGMQWESE